VVVTSPYDLPAAAGGGGSTPPAARGGGQGGGQPFSLGHTTTPLMVFWGDASTQHCWMRVFALAVHDVCQAPTGLHCEAWGKTLEGTTEKCSGDMGKQVWGTRHTPLGCRYPMGSPTPPWRAGSQCAAPSRPSFSKSLTHTLLSQGCRAPLQRIFFFTPRGRGRRRGKKKTPCHRHGGHTHNAAVTQAPGTMLLWPRALWQGVEGGTCQQCAPMPAMAAEGRHGGGSPLCVNPLRRPRRRGTVLKKLYV